MNSQYVQIIPHSKKYEFTKTGFEIVKVLLSEGKTYTYISRIFGINPDTLSLLCRESGIAKDNRRIYTINENYFSNIDLPEKAYWLGFLDADGSINRNKINLTLQRRDEKTIQKFLDSIGSNKPIKYKTVYLKGEKECKQAYVSIDSISLVKDLERYGCARNKSLTLFPPVLLSKDLVPYWVLGYMDGDGSISTFSDKNRNNYLRLKISFTGTKEVLEFIKKFFQNSAKIVREHHCQNNTYRFSVTETKAIDFLTYVYSDRRIYEISLDRKRDKFFEYMRYRKERHASKSTRNSAQQGI